MDLPAHEHISIFIHHNAHKAEGISLQTYINECDILPAFLREELKDILKADDFWQVTYVLDGRYCHVASSSYEKCIQRINEFLSLTEPK